MLLCVLLFYCLDHLFYCFIVWTICPFILIECHTWHCSILLALESVLSGNLSALLSSLCFICTLCCYIPTCFLRACLEALAGEHSTPLTGDWSSSVGTVVLWPSGSCRRDTCGVVTQVVKAVKTQTVWMQSLYAVYGMMPWDVWVGDTNLRKNWAFR